MWCLDFQGGGKFRKNRWIIGVFVFACLTGACLLQFTSEATHPADAQSPYGEAVNSKDGFLRADLGGVLVAIPSYFAEYVEYDGDPGWGKARQGSKPVRTQKSKIASFGFDVRFPDMAGKSTPELREDYKNRKLATNQWIDVGFNSGEMYSGPGSAERIGRGAINSESNSWLNRYKKLKQDEYGLEVYALVGGDPKEGKPAREHRDAEDVFIKRDNNGKITTYISCSNREIPSPPCRHFFDLEPEMHASVRVGYRRGLLSEWRQIQKKVKETTLGFAVSAKN